MDSFLLNTFLTPNKSDVTIFQKLSFCPIKNWVSLVYNCKNESRNDKFYNFSKELTISNLKKKGVVEKKNKNVINFISTKKLP